MTDPPEPRDQPNDAGDEKQVVAELLKDARNLPITALAIGSSIVVTVVLLAIGGEGALTTIATCIGTVATLLALLVALAIFRWTQRQSADQSAKLFDINGKVVDVLSAMGPTLLDGAEEGDDGADAEPDASDLGHAVTVAGRDYEVVTDPLRYDGAWWLWMLSRIAGVAGDDGPYASEARQLLRTPLAEIRAIAKLADTQRGNRRTLLITQSGSELRYWSVFVGNGSHVKDVTVEVSEAGLEGMDQN